MEQSFRSDDLGPFAALEGRAVRPTPIRGVGRFVF
jgi:hypothetical protein